MNVRRSDTYSEVISKICAVLELEETDECRLFTAGGSVISDAVVFNNNKNKNKNNLYKMTNSLYSKRVIQNILKHMHR